MCVVIMFEFENVYIYSTTEFSQTMRSRLQKSIQNLVKHLRWGV